MNEVATEPLTSIANFKEFKVVENSELGVAYKDQVIELPQHRQNETGITRLRIRRVTKLPGEVEAKIGWLASYKNRTRSSRFREVFPALKGMRNANLSQSEHLYKDQLHFLTNGRFPSEQTWSHQYLGDWSLTGSERGFDPQVETIKKTVEGDLTRFIKQGLFFQEVSPKNLLDKIEGRELKLARSLGDKAIYRNLPPLFGGGPFAFFEREADSNLAEVNVNRNGDKVIQLLESGEPWLYGMSATEGDSYSGKQWLVGIPLFVFGNQNAAFVDYMTKLLVNPEVREMMNKSIEGQLIQVETLERLLKGEEIADIKRGHPRLPIAGNVGLPPFRWSHAELALVGTQKGLNIVFFETEKSTAQENKVN